MIFVVRGDILKVPQGYILHQTNCVGCRPAGLAAKIAEAFPGTCPYERRRLIRGSGNICVEEDRATPGTVEIVDRVINLYGQYMYGKPNHYGIVGDATPDDAATREGYFRQGLEALLDHFDGSETPISLAVPFRIGCGLAGGNWDHYNTMLEEFVVKARERQIPIRVTIYRHD